MTFVDAGLPEPWPSQIEDAVKLFRQGHVVENPPFFYAASSEHGVWDLTRETGDLTEPEETFELDGSDRPPFGILTTQTCDIWEQGTPKRPWISLCPVWDVTDSMPRVLQGNIDRKRVLYLVRLDGPNFGDRFWIADLRIDIPIEKSWLVGRIPIEGFGSDESSLDFAHRLAARVSRPALANEVTETLLRPLRSWLDGLGTNGASVHGPVREIRLALQGPHEAPTAAELLILSDVQLDQEIREQWEEWWARVARDAVESGKSLALLPPRILTLDELTARRYASSVRIDLQYLSPEA